MTRYAVARNGLVENIGGIQIAKDGVIKRVARAVLACEGTALEFFPPDGASEDQIFWTTDPLTTDDLAILPENATATILFETASGIYYYYQDDVLFFDYFLRPPTTNTGEFLIRLDILAGGPFIGPPDGVWIDIHSNGPLFNWDWRLEQAAVGLAIGEADITIAQDDPGSPGSPLAGTEVVKQVSFRAQVTSDALLWTSAPWDIEEVKVNEIADCELIFDINGDARGLGDTSGDFEEPWADGPQPNYTVQVDLISGDPPVGDMLGVPLLLDTGRIWTLTATLDEAFANELDVTVTDELANFTVKRVTMTSVQDTTISQVDWPDTFVAVLDAAGIGTPIGATLTSRGDGTANVTRVNAGQHPAFPEDWHEDAPNPLNSTDYEVRLRIVSGDPPDLGSDATDVWLNAGFTRNWQWNINSSEPAIKSAQTEWGYRKVGEASTEVLRPVGIEINGGV